VPIRSRRAPPIDGRETIILRLEPIESAMDREMSTTYPFPPPQERSVTGSGDPIFPCVSFNLDVPTGAPIYTEGPGEENQPRRLVHHQRVGSSIAHSPYMKPLSVMVVGSRRNSGLIASMVAF
jgi:hypothetical protein